MSSLAVPVRKQRSHTLVGPGRAAAWQVEADAPFGQPKHAFDFELAGTDARVFPQVKLAPGRKLFFRFLAPHGIGLFDVAT